MKKIKVMIGFLFAIFGSTQIINAMHHAKMALFSKTGFLAVAGPLALMYGQQKMLPLHESTSSLSLNVQQQIIDTFKNEHGIDIEIRNANKNVLDATGVQLENGKYILHVASHDRVLLSTSSPEESGLNEVFAHEYSHVKHNDLLTRIILTNASLGAPLLAGKLARVKGKNKLISLGIGLSTFVTAILIHRKIYRTQEKRCDLEAATTPEKARALRDYFNIFGRDEVLALSRAPAPVKHLYQALSTHPLIVERMDYLEKRAQQLEKQK